MKNHKRGYDLLASQIQDTIINLLKVTNEPTVDPAKVAFQVGRLNQTSAILDDIEVESQKHLQVLVSIEIKEKSNGKQR